ncbi:hypothetical protein KFL_000440230 [Klebsormidium nitens]|uniref:Ribosomal RNA large subunit methyltransferase K/L-like methyltransferase domain-containing protein n=1 Tax=Klebsormidium nitens TaxID=105231 RepID=A0A1Y1HQF3_KLENI|nr:hypothetical protein KFL_000440230 [Klebsormidium nitens]|eukprot:GAQ80022.1 hypothetical protein KFL_000440230 [Klebsormidium nitens]
MEAGCSFGPYLSTCAGGLENVLLQELASRLYGVQVLSSHAGATVFSTSGRPEDLKALRAADNIYAYLIHKEGVPLDKEQGLAYLQAIAMEIDWGRALATFRQWNPGVAIIAWPSSNSSEGCSAALPRFRVTCERRTLKLPKHGYTSMEAAGWLGAGVGALLGWPVSMTHFDVELIATITDDEVLLSLSLLYSPRAKQNASATGPPDAANEMGREEEPLQAKAHHQSRQLYSHRPYRSDLVRTSLKPSTAYALCQLADIRPGHVVLDPLCGCGTIPLEAADFYGPSIAAFAGELLEDAVAKAGRNLAAGQQGGRPGPCDVIRWDATRLPWRDRTVDRVISDMPFGILCGSPKERNNVFPSVLKEIARVLVPGTGRAVLLCQGRKVRADLKRVPTRDFFLLEKTFSIDMEGILVDVHILQRTEVEVVVKPRLTPNRRRDRSRQRKGAANLTGLPAAFVDPME